MLRGLFGLEYVYLVKHIIGGLTNFFEVDRAPEASCGFAFGSWIYRSKPGIGYVSAVACTGGGLPQEQGRCFDYSRHLKSKKLLSSSTINKSKKFEGFFIPLRCSDAD